MEEKSARDHIVWEMWLLWIENIYSTVYTVQSIYTYIWGYFTIRNLNIVPFSPWSMYDINHSNPCGLFLGGAFVDFSTS